MQQQHGHGHGSLGWPKSALGNTVGGRLGGGGIRPMGGAGGGSTSLLASAHRTGSGLGSTSVLRSSMGGAGTRYYDELLGAAAALTASGGPGAGAASGVLEVHSQASELQYKVESLESDLRCA